MEQKLPLLWNRWCIMVRMIFYGGAKKASDNSSFYYASRNVIKDYKNDISIIDKFVEELSELLYDAEKNNSVVIGHITKANPLINGDGKTTIAQQDYRHGGRNIYNNGDKLSTSYTKWRIGANEINLALKSR